MIASLAILDMIANKLLKDKHAELLDVASLSIMFSNVNSKSNIYILNVQNATLPMKQPISVTRSSFYLQNVPAVS